MKTRCFFLALIVIYTSLFPAMHAAHADAAFLTYTPYRGSISFSTSNSQNREATATFRWNRTGCTEFDSENDTYEQELVFYNYDGNAYATSMSSSYKTNLPQHYGDTRLCDSPNEINLAVGTFKANQIRPNTEYFVTYRLLGGNGNRSMYKISVQEGCYLLIPSEYTVFSQSSTKLIPFKNGFTAPEFRYWTTEVEYNDSIQSADVSKTNRWISGTISRTNDVDYVKLYLRGRRCIRFISPEGNNIDYDVKIYDQNGKYTGFCLTSSSSEQTITRNFKDGYYYFKIYPHGEGTSSLLPYYLIVT